MRTACHEVDLRYSEEELHAIFGRAHADVEAGGRYDARSAAINIGSHSWTNDATWEESRPSALSISIGPTRTTCP